MNLARFKNVFMFILISSEKRFELRVLSVRQFRRVSAVTGSCSSQSLTVGLLDTCFIQHHCVNFYFFFHNVLVLSNS